MLTIRQATETDLVAADHLLKAAFGTAGTFRPILRRCFRLQPQGWWVAEQDRQIWGYGGAVDYGDLAYVGLMGVHPHRQRQGIGRQILLRILHWLDQQGCPLVALDATDAGVPLYRSCGFVETEKSFTYWREGQPLDLMSPSTPDQIQILRTSDFDDLIQLDHHIFGANRSRLLRSLLWENLERGWLVRDLSGQIQGFILAPMDTLGPWMATDPEIATGLLQRALRLPFEPSLRLYVPGSNLTVPALLQPRGFQQRQILSHMQRGASISVGQRQSLYSLINYACG